MRPRAYESAAMIPCDGCGRTHKPGDLAYITEGAYQVRYCAPCHLEWTTFETAHNALAQLKQRELELWTEEARRAVPLRVTPMDFPEALAGAPTVLSTQNGTPLVLG